MTKIRDELLEILVCPKCKTKVVAQGGSLRCMNPDCGLIYPVENDVPVMLVDRATAPKKSSDAACEDI